MHHTSNCELFMSFLKQTYSSFGLLRTFHEGFNTTIKYLYSIRHCSLERIQNLI